MHFKGLAAVLAFAGALALLAAPADAQTKKKRVVTSNGHTVFVSRDEDGRTRTKIIIQKRSYLSAGTEVMPGDRNDYDYAVSPTHHAGSVLDNTVAGGNMSPLPGPFSLPSKNNPWLNF